MKGPRTKLNSLQIVESQQSDLEDILEIHRQAFGRDEEAQLVEALLADESARPTLSLLATAEQRSLGHVLFTAMSLDKGNAGLGLRAALLAPLAVRPVAQCRGVGRALIEQGAAMLAQRGLDLVFVLGDPNYYTRCGFRAARPYGLEAPYPIVPAEAWMLHPLRENVLGVVRGVLRCADSLSPRKYWQE